MFPDTQPVSVRIATTALLVAIILPAATWWSCERSTGDQITRARTAYAQNRLDEALQLFSAVLEEDGSNVEALVGVANIHVDRRELELAAQQLAVLDRLELDRREEVLVRQVRRRYLLLLFDRSRGAGPVAPTDPERYEEALIGLFNLEGTEQYRTELINWFAYNARKTLAVADVTAPLAPDSSYLDSARLDQLESALAGYQRLTERDPRVTRVLRLPGDLQVEAEVMVLALRYLIFERNFLARFQSTLMPGLMESGRFDPATGMIRIELVEQLEGEIPSQEEMDAFRAAVARDLVIDELTTLAYIARDLERGDNPPLVVGQSVTEVEEAYAGILIETFEIARNRQVTVHVLAPYPLLVQTASRLEQYLDWLARRGQEIPTPPGTAPGAEPGTGAGTGQPAEPPEGTETEQPTEAPAEPNP
ncbi:MAG: hypothetical protein JW797_02880 [Bradymonadales bacterium]|nr:hypothetical protein [Bradymonadales bacterium]